MIVTSGAVSRIKSKHEEIEKESQRPKMIPEKKKKGKRFEGVEESENERTEKSPKYLVSSIKK